MTTLIYDNKTKTIGADTRVTFDNYVGFCTKIVFPKTNVVLATAGDSGACEWLRYKLSVAEKIHDLYNIEPDSHPKFEELECFIWWNGPYFVTDELCPMPIEQDYWHAGTGGAYALAYMAAGWSMEKAIEGAAKLDPNTGTPIHIVDCSLAKKKVKVYQGGLLKVEPEKT